MSRYFLLLACGVALIAQTPLLPLSEVRPGMRGVGKTIFQGDRVEEFQAEVLGVLENAGPKQSIILARLSGGPLEKTGVLQGMSGSPVYVNGRLMGAVALSFAFSKEPIAGVTPIAEMMEISELDQAIPSESIPVNGIPRAQSSKTSSGGENVSPFDGGNQLVYLR